MKVDEYVKKYEMIGTELPEDLKVTVVTDLCTKHPQGTPGAEHPGDDLQAGEGRENLLCRAEAQRFQQWDGARPGAVGPALL